MKATNLSLIESIGDYAYQLIAVHPSLRLFGQDLSPEDLSQLAAVVQSESNTGRPVRPPTEFILEVKRVVPEKTWRKLTTLLEKWSNASELQSESRLSVQEHEYLTMGILWQTLLITECKWRHDAIQEQFTAIEAGT